MGEFIVDLLLDLFFEGSIALAERKSSNKVVRIIIVTVLIVLFSAVVLMIGALSIYLMTIKEYVPAFILMGITILLIILGIRRFIRIMNGREE